MDEKKPRRWLKWMLVVAGTAIGLAAIVFIVAQIMFAVNAIPQERMTPPAKLLALKADKENAPVAFRWPDVRKNESVDPNAIQTQYLEFYRAKHPKAVNLEILAKWQSRLKGVFEEYHKHFDPKFISWDAGQPINGEQAKWLIGQREFIEDMVRMANAGGLPETTCEEAAAISDENLSRRMNPYFFYVHALSKALAAEGQRRQDAGDLAGAAEIVVALSRLERSADEPALMDVAIANNNSFGQATFATLKNLLQGDLTPEIAKKLRDEFDNIPAEDYRRQLEISYRGERYQYVNLLNGPFSDLFLMQMALEKPGFSGGSDLAQTYWSYLESHTFDTLGQSIQPALQAAEIKSKANAMTALIDEHFMQIHGEIQAGEFLESRSELLCFGIEEKPFHQAGVCVLFPGIGQIIQGQAQSGAGRVGLCARYIQGRRDKPDRSIHERPAQGHPERKRDRDLQRRHRPQGPTRRRIQPKHPTRRHLDPPAEKKRSRFVVPPSGGIENARLYIFRLKAGLRTGIMEFTMDEKQPRHWRKWLMIAVIIAIGAPMTVLAILPLIFSMHAIPKEQQAPPAMMLTVKPAANVPRINFKRPVLTAKNTRTNMDELARARAEMLIEYERAKNQKSPLIDPYKKFLSLWNYQLGKDFMALRPQKWLPGDSPSDAQIKWLLEHKELVEALMQMADAGGFPMISCEEAAGFTEEQLANMPLFTPSMYPIMLIMTCESQRLKDSGDEAGAAKTLIALDSLTRSISQPHPSNLMLSMNMKNMADQLLSKWIEGSMKPEIAQQLRDKLDRPWVNPRKVFELDYRCTRYWIVKDLNKNYMYMYKNQMQVFVSGKSKDPNLADKLEHACETAWYTVRIKAAADSVLQEYDAKYGKFLDQAGSDKFLPENSRTTRGEYDFYLDHVGPRFSNPQADFTRKAQMILNLAALDRIIDPEQKNPITRLDPYTAQPLKVSETADATVIYSIGPDGKDQLGIARYDPSQWRNKTGDIVIRVPKKERVRSPAIVIRLPKRTNHVIRVFPCGP